MKALVIINEPFSEMMLGKNTTLSYIISLRELGYEVYIHTMSKDPTAVFPRIGEIEVSRLDKSDAEILAVGYRNINNQMQRLIKDKNYGEIANLKVKAGECLQERESLSLDEVDFVCQRLEPMKAPFPPQGNKDVAETLRELKAAFPQHVFNCPIRESGELLEDKQIPQDINRALGVEVATPTAEFTLDSAGGEIEVAALTMGGKYQELFVDKSFQKIVLKPKNSAQSLGVFAIEFVGDGLGFEEIKSKKITELLETQTYKIKDNLPPEELKEVMTALCYIQRVRDLDVGDATIAEKSPAEISTGAKELYNAEILAQPFLEGVKCGDIRANFLKDAKGNFFCAGYTFRSSAREEGGGNFTTCLTTGGSYPKSISSLALEEQENLEKNCADVLRVLNSDLRADYRNSIELGADFILAGDGKKVFLGEINHFCPALLPQSEAIRAMESEDGYGYDGGLGLAKAGILATIAMQEKRMVPASAVEVVVIKAIGGSGRCAAAAGAGGDL